jgi:hypothetical protein
MRLSDKQDLLTILDEGRDAFLQAVSGLTDDMARRNPGPDRWSVLECVEHVAVAEEYMLLQLQNATPAEPVINATREYAIKKRAGVRTTRVEAPDAAKPIGRFSSVTNAVEHFLACRQRTIQLVRAAEDLRALSTTHPIIGPVNGYEMLLMMAMHPRRHALQIAEITNAPAK